jgi:hypothetical protein
MLKHFLIIVVLLGAATVAYGKGQKADTSASQTQMLAQTDTISAIKSKPVATAFNKLEDTLKVLSAQGILCGIGIGVSTDERGAIFMAFDDATSDIVKRYSSKITLKPGTTLSTSKAIVRGAETHERITEYNKETGKYTIYTLVIAREIKDLLEPANPPNPD